jgi:uncharacterized protein (TIGR03792 family)
VSVVEFLTFAVPAHERSEWMAIEEATWSRFLERQVGFVRKQVWVEEDDPDHVHVMIEWESLEQWKAIAAEQLAAVDASMGAWMRDAACRTFRVLRHC